MAGLYLATELVRKSKRKVVVVEKYKELGGRASTFHQEVDGKKLQWEAGAGRISEHHHIVRELMRRYKLTWVPIGGDTQYIEGYGDKPVPHAFESGMPSFLYPLAGLPAEELATHTLRELLVKVHGARADEYCVQYPYRGELDTLRADIGLKMFQHEFSLSEKYAICGEGLSAIVEGLRKEFEAKGGKILLEHTCAAVEQVRRGPVKITCMAAGEPVTLEAKHCVLAVPVTALKEIRPFDKWRPADHVAMKPLLRFYGVFSGDPWTNGRVVTATPIRYMIPGNPAIGSVQMSYTDSQDAESWKAKLDRVGEKAVGEEILGELRRLVAPTIPPPSFVKAHYWEHGVSYWLPGTYDPREESRKAYRPLKDMPSVHLCGESFSMRQGWIEGALEHAAGLLRLLE
jgi:monoamine oxidase